MSEPVVTARSTTKPASANLRCPARKILTYRPDTKISKGAVVKGANVYEANAASPGAASTLTTTTPKTGTTLNVGIENDGGLTDKIVIKGPKTNTQFTITYKLGATNITAAVTSASGYTTAALTKQGTAGASKTITMTIVPKATTKKGSKLTAVITAASKTLSTKKDGVKTVVTY